MCYRNNLQVALCLKPSLNFLAVTLSRWPCRLQPSFISQIERGEKGPTLLVEKSREVPSGVVYLSRVTHHSYYGPMGGLH